jgi:hypothetical protein
VFTSLPVHACCKKCLCNVRNKNTSCNINIIHGTGGVQSSCTTFKECANVKLISFYFFHCILFLPFKNSLLHVLQTSDKSRMWLFLGFPPDVGLVGCDVVWTSRYQGFGETYCLAISRNPNVIIAILSHLNTVHLFTSTFLRFSHLRLSFCQF